MARTKFDTEPTVAHATCPEGCSVIIDCPVTVRFETDGKGTIRGTATIQTQPMWDHVLAFHGPDDFRCEELDGRGSE